MGFHFLQQSQVELVILVPDAQSLLFRVVAVLLHIFELRLTDHLVILPSDLAGQRAIILQVKYHLLVLRLLICLAVVKPAHCRYHIS